MMKLQHPFWILMIFLSAINQLNAQGCIQIMDSISREPLPYASIEANNFFGTTDQKGVICLEKLLTYRLSYIGYEEREFLLPKGLKDTMPVYLKISSNILSTAVVSGNKSGERLVDAIAPLDILSSEIINSRSTPNIEEHVNRLPGVQMIDGQISIRGGAGFAYGAGSRVALLLNGIPMILPDAGSISWNDLPIELIERVELVKGPAATLYGSSALNGVIQMNSWQGATDTAYSELLLGFRGIGPSGNEDRDWYTLRPSYWGHLIHKDRKGDFQWQGSLRAESNTTHYNSAYDQRLRTSFLGKYRDDNREWGIQFLMNRFTGRSFLYWEDAENRIFYGDPVSELNDDIFRVQLDPYVKWKDKGSGQHMIQTRLFYSNNNASSDRGSEVRQFLGQYQYDLALFRGRAKLTSGIMGQAFRSDAALFGDNSLWGYQGAAFSRYEQLVFPKLRVFAGVRAEYNSQKAGTIIFDSDTINADDEAFQPIVSAGLHYDLWKGTAISLHYGEGYRFPSIAEKFITTSLGPTAISPNPFLQEETGNSLNLSLKQIFPVGGLQSFFRLDLFWMRYQNMIEFGIQSPSLGFQALNVGGTDIKGVEASWTGEWNRNNWNGLFLMSYTYLNPIFADFDQDSVEILARSSADFNILKYRVQHQLSLQNTVQWKRWQLGTSILYNSDMEAIDKILELFVIQGLGEYRAEDKGAFLTVDLSLGYHFKRVSLLMDVQNVFNKMYSLRPGLIEPPRTFNFQIKYRF